MQGKKTSESKVVQTHLILPGETNTHNTLFGGNLLRMVDSVAGICFHRHSRATGVTASVDRLNFIAPLPRQHSVCLEAMVSGVGNRSVEIFVKITGENLLTGERYLAATAFLTFVVKDDNIDGVPGVIPETEEDRYIMSGYKARREERFRTLQKDQEFQSNLSIDKPW